MLHNNLRTPRLRFSLRTAAVCFTALCLWLGLLAASARRQQLAVAELARLGATVSYDRRVEQLWAPNWLRRFVGDDFFLNVEYVQLHHSRDGRIRRPLTPAEIDAAIAAMARLPRLGRIHFAHTEVTDDDLARFAPIAGQIEELYFNEGWRSNLTGAGLEHRAKWPRLASLGMPYGSKDPRAVERLPNFPALATLTWGGGRLDAEGFDAIARCRKLERLTLRACNFQGAAFSRLTTAPRLKQVDLHNTQPAHYARYWSGDGMLLPQDDDPRNVFEFEPHREGPEDPNAPAFPEKHYREWLEQTLPGIAVSESYSS